MNTIKSLPRVTFWQGLDKFVRTLYNYIEHTFYIKKGDKLF